MFRNVDTLLRPSRAAKVYLLLGIICASVGVLPPEVRSRTEAPVAVSRTYCRPPPPQHTFFSNLTCNPRA